MTNWEYATVPLLVHATKQILDTWGEDGWELVSVTPHSWDTEDGHSIVNECIYYFKREKK